MNNTKNRSGNKQHKRTEPFVCVMCGEIAYTTIARRNDAKYCSKKCRSESQSLARRENYISEPYQPKIGGPYKIIKDPDRSWGYNSSFQLKEIMTLAKLSYLTPGSQFMHKEKKIAYEVIETKPSKMQLKQIHCKELV